MRLRSKLSKAEAALELAVKERWACARTVLSPPKTAHRLVGMIFALWFELTLPFKGTMRGGGVIYFPIYSNK